MELIVANCTPFSGEEVDLDGVRRHVRWLAASGATGVAPTGTTGEFLYLSQAEKRAVHEATLEAAGSISVIPCVWSPRLADARALARAAESGGARAVFSPPPLYHVVSRRAIVAWYGAIQEAVSIPVWAYHHGRTHNPLTPALVRELLEELGLEAFKDSSGDPLRVRGLAAAHPGRIYAGGDHLLGSGAALGLAGHISGLANLYPGLALEHVRAAAGPTPELLERIRQVKAAGSVRAMKRRLGFGNRAPMDDLDAALADALPPGA